MVENFTKKFLLEFGWLMVLGSTYIDDHVRKENVAIYLGKKIYHTLDRIWFISRPFNAVLSPNALI